MKHISIFINGIRREVMPNQTIMQACESYGVKIPHFCFHEKLSVAGNCRMCLVEETKKSAKPLQASCAINVLPDMSVYTNTALVKKAREGVLEFLLANHPLDCPICDQGGECDLQDQSLVFGSDRGRFYESKRSVEDKNFGVLVKTVMTRCIHCTRCVRFAREVAGLETFGITGRGSKMEIGFYIQNYLDSEVSGNIIDVCPVGALTSKPYAFKARPWDLLSHSTIDLFDAFGSNIRVDVLNNKIVRILPRINKKINDCWISDKVRFSYDAYKLQRLLFPLTKVENSFLKTTWDFSFNAIMSFLAKHNYNDLVQIWNIPLNAGLETQFNAITYFRSCGAKFIIPNASKVTFDFRSSINAKSLLVDNLNKTDLVLLVNTNPKIESSVFNLYLRQITLSGAKVFTLGFFNKLNFNTTSLGSDISILSKIAEGKHYICYYLLKAKMPLILCGSEIVNQCAAYFDVLKLIQKLILNFNLSASPVVSVLPSFAFEPNMHELALSTNSLATNALTYSNFKALLFLNTDSSFCRPIKLFKGSKFLISCNAFGSKDLLTYDLLLPIHSNFEMSEHFLNLQGFLQKTKPIFLNIGAALPYYSFFNTLSNKLKNLLSEGATLVDNNAFLSRMLGYSLSTNSLSVLSKVNWLNHSKFKTNQSYLKNVKTFLSSNVCNFYVSSQSLTSRIMTLCSKQFTSTKTFYRV